MCFPFGCGSRLWQVILPWCKWGAFGFSSFLLPVEERASALELRSMTFRAVTLSITSRAGWKKRGRMRTPTWPGDSERAATHQGDHAHWEQV